MFLYHAYLSFLILIMSSLYVVFSSLIRLASGFFVLPCGVFFLQWISSSIYQFYLCFIFRLINFCLSSFRPSFLRCILLLILYLPGWNAYSFIFVFLFQKNKCLRWNFPFMIVLAVSYCFRHRVFASFLSKLVWTCNFDFLLFSNGVLHFEVGGWFATRDYHIKWNKSERERQ